MSLKYYGQVLRKRWLAIVAMTVIGVLAAVGLTVLMSPRYQAEATGTVVPKATTAQQGATTVQSTVQSLPPLVYSPYVLKPVIKQLSLGLTVHQLDEKVSASVPSGSFNLKVQATASKAKLAQQIANAVAESLAAYINGSNRASGGQSLPASLVTASFDVPALRPRSPSSPQPVLNVALGALIGLALGIALAIVREQLDTSIRTTDDLSRLSGASPLGTIRNDSEFQTRPLVSMHQETAGVEDFRSIRTNLQFVDVDSPPRQIVISSAVANEGKSVTACNIATTMAQADVKVCLVEGDLRRPRATNYLGLDGTLGLTDVAAGTHRLDEALIPWHRQQITVLPAGTTPPDPAQFLGSKAMTGLLDELRQRFDLVIIDAPPLLPVSDAAVLGAVSDGVILVARYRHVKRDQFATAIESLAVVNAKLLGTVLTRVPARHKRSYYGHYRTASHRFVDNTGSGPTQSVDPTPTEGAPLRKADQTTGAQDATASAVENTDTSTAQDT
ncbi:polysaccharide biosynthesis tyrosine autokinase, partial [uncultured Jatrophihabitans sp.]|uniref:polysaccharide biosynthesis tyrosine autokinase n=1 Tax=uncultured Jatrophihabitans sp. TaxID=1610747 RepID=UPI0035CA7EBB